jgi:EAL domain-containing protein (putative c-di-GMP-specific phosphodiesterase class I)
VAAIPPTASAPRTPSSRRPRRAELDPCHLVLEITKTVLMKDREAATANLRRLKELGVRVAVDD